MKNITLEKPKVLVTDDDEATRILLRAAITRWGYNVIEASNGEEAWDILQQPDAPQILILDWLMPKLNGIELCKRIQKKLNFHPYIIFLTRMTGTENVIQGLEAGADEFIFKPFDLSELRIRIFAGERIIKYRDQLSEKNRQLKILTSAIETLGPNARSVETTSATKPRRSKLRTKIIDLARMKEFFGNDKHATKEFIKTFIALFTEQLKAIETAIANKDTANTKYYFHLLGGASGNSGMKPIFNICGKAEESVLIPDWKTVEKCYDALKDMLVKLKAEMESL